MTKLSEHLKKDGELSRFLLSSSDYYVPETNTFIPTTTQVHVESGQDANHFVDFYLYCLNLQKESLKDKFTSEDTLFYNEIFSINEKDLPLLKKDMKKVLKSYLIKSENPQGDSAAVMNLGLFKQFFKN